MQKKESIEVLKHKKTCLQPPCFFFEGRILTKESEKQLVH